MVMSDYTHLDSRHQALADLPDDERIQWIRADRWISHPPAEIALDPMEGPAFISAAQSYALPPRARPHWHGKDDDAEEVLS
jgi:hypothetical protein